MGWDGRARARAQEIWREETAREAWRAWFCYVTELEDVAE